MPHIVLERNGVKIEGDLSLADIKELMGMASANGNHSSAPVPIPAPRKRRGRRPKVTNTVTNSEGGDFEGFIADIADRGRLLINVLKDHPEGINAYELAKRLHFDNPVQIGGVIGGTSMSKFAAKHGIVLSDVYSRKTTFPDGVRTVTYYPGSLVLKMEKPA